VPFTFSHPAIVLPFLKNKKLSATGLVIGSMSPDLEYFFRMKMQGDIGHTLLGVFLVDIPLGVLVACLFHQIIKRPLIDNLPDFFKERLYVLKESNWLNYFKSNIWIVIISFILGIFSHVFWDSFTHENGYFVQRIYFLGGELNTIPFYKIAQHLSSLIGMGFILFYIYKLPKRIEERNKINLKYWISVIGLTLIILSIRFAFGMTFKQIGSVVVSAISSLFLGLTLTGLIFRNRKTI
jgi:signal peptidase I